MPETKSILLRIRPAGVDWLDKVAARTSQPRSKVIRAALAVARKHESELIKELEGSL